jgi:hypothetical protein
VDGFSAKPNVRDGRDAHPARTGGAVMTASACRKGDTAALVLSQWVFLRTSAPPSPRLTLAPQIRTPAPP